LKKETRTFALRIFLGSGLILLAFFPPGIFSLDGNGILAVTESRGARHSLTVSPDLGVPGRGRNYYVLWYPLQSFVSVPLVAVAFPVAA
jgi:hypothetical protein